MVDDEDVGGETTTTTLTTSEAAAAETTTLIPKATHCPAPDVTYNGSLLSGGSAEAAAFKDIQDVEFEVRTGPFPGDNQRCKLTCIEGQWVGPLCRTSEGTTKYKYLHYNYDLCHTFSVSFRCGI
jgi:hypothetical protein